MNFFSTSWTSGSLAVRPSNRFKDPMVFLKLDVSWVFADSPIDRCLGPKATKDLAKVRKGQERIKPYARRSAIGDFIGDDIDTSMSRDTNLDGEES